MYRYLDCRVPVVSGGGQATLAEYEFLSADMLMFAGHMMLGGETSKNIGTSSVRFYLN
jgi:hypothetical protein